MKPHPDFETHTLPKHAQVGDFHLDVLSPQDVEEDYDAVIESADVLVGLFGDDWPSGLTLDDNLKDLTRHAREFDAAYAFAWIIRSGDTGRYLGCAYLNPTRGTAGQGKVVTWIRACDDRLDILGRFNAAFRDWLEGHLPKGFALSWTSNDAISVR